MQTDPHGLHVLTDAGTELEVQELLVALVRVLRPRLVVETGCFDGRTTLQLVRGAESVGGTRVVTCDTDPARVLEACTRLSGSAPVWEVRNCRGIDLPELRQADFVFCDSDYSARVEEMLAVKPGAVIVVHDTDISYHPEIQPLAGWVEAHRGITFKTWRGFGILKVPAGGWQS